MTALLSIAAVVAPDPARPRQQHLYLRLTIDDQRRSVEGIAEYRYAASGAPVDAFTFAQRDLQIRKVEADPQPVRSFQVEKDRVNIEVAGGPAGTASRLRIYYGAQPKEGLYFHRTLTETGVPVTQVWQYEDWAWWMPQPADPDQLLDWEFVGEVRSDWQVVSNGELVSVETAGGRRAFHWRQPIPARLEGFTFAAGNFEVHEQRSGPWHIVNYVPIGVADAATVARSFGRVPQMLELFSREFGAYPFGDFRQVVLWDYHPQGTEHLGLSCLSENKLIEKQAQLDADDYIVAHELAHNWWAVLVAPKSRAHVWLSEGFAVYFGNQFFEAADGRDEFEYRLRRRRQLYLEEDRKYRRVLVSDDAVPGGLDEHIYSKGAYILHMLRRYLTDEKFFAGLRRFAQQHAFARADSADFQRAMEQVSGEKLDWYFQPWLFGKGYPIIKVERAWDESAHVLTLSMRQLQDAAAGVYRLPVQIQIVTDVGTETHDEVLQERSETRSYRLKGQLRYVRFDADNRLLAAVDFPRTAEELVAQLNGASDALGRIEAAEALADTPDQPATQALERALRTDGFHGVRSAAALALSHRGAEAVAGLLNALRRETDSRVLQDVAVALEPSATRQDVGEALRRAAISQASPYVRARALRALARARVDRTFDLLMSALSENAHRDVVRVAAFEAFGELGDGRAVPAIMRYLQSDRTTRFGREAAVEALGKLAPGDPAALALLQRIQKEDFWPGVRERAVQALAAQRADR